MKRRNADCGKIRRPIKKNKIAEQIGSNTLLYIKFLLLWASVITADFLLEFRFEFLWPFWLLLRSIYDSFKYKGLAFSVLFVCIAVTSDLVCLFFIPVQWLFFAASTYVWVQYVWHTDKGICLPTIILWILFVYLEAAIRWKDSRNIPHLNLCRPFAAHCIGYPVVTLGFGFKSYVGYRIRQRKQREVAKDNDFYLQLLQEALPKEESTAAMLESVADGPSSNTEQHLTQKELVPVLATSANNSLNNSSGSTTSNRSDTGQQHHHHHPNNHNHHHHHHNHQQQQNHSKGAQSYKASTGGSVASPHVNGHVSSGGSSPPASSGAMNGGLTHSTHQQQQQQQGFSKHRKSLDKDSNSSSSASSTGNAGSKMNGSGGVGGSYSYHQATTFQPTHGGSNAPGNSGSSSGSSTGSSSATNSTKENTSTGARVGEQHGGSIHCNGGSVMKDKDPKEGGVVSGALVRKDYDKDASSSSSSSSNSGRNGPGQTTTTATTTTNRSKSPTESLGTKSMAGKQNGHASHHHQSAEWLQQQQQQATETIAAVPVTTEAKGGGRSGRKNRLKKAAEQANLSAIAKLCATLALASSVTTLTTTTSATTTGTGGGGGDRATTLTSSSSTNSGGISSVSAKDNHPPNSEQESGKVLPGAADGTQHVPVTSDGKHSSGVAPTHGGPKAGSSCLAGNPATSVTTVLVQKPCESCPRLEGDLKKLRSEVESHRRTENDLRQKYDSTTGNLKACLQAKQKDYDELQSRYQEHSTQRQQERQNLQTVERRLGEERRHRQSLEAQLNNERKYRKQAEEKAARADCGEACKIKKQQMEIEIEKLQHDLLNLEDTKLMADKQLRTFEQEMRKMEMQVRTPNAEVLMSALAAMQDKNATLEKNLSAETRVKLDLFSALGGTRREVEILTCTLRSKEKEILDLNAKIVQLVAVMPTMPADALCLTGHGGGSGSDGSSLMRLADAPQLLPQHINGVGPGAGTNGIVGSGNGSQSSPMSHMGQNGSPFCSQLGNLGVLTSTMTTLPSASVLAGPMAPGTGSNCGVPGPPGSGCQIVQMPNGGTNGGGGNCPSNLDPNATIYTPKNNGMVGGTEA